MILIAHRGLVNGPNKDIENNPRQIELALKQGYDCEIDLWVIDDKLWLGHDLPTYEIELGFIATAGLWIHAKNLDALYWLTKTNLNYFWHEEDQFTLTSHRYIWTYPGKTLTKNSVMVMPEWNDPLFENIDKNCFGICTDYPARLLDKK